MNLRDLMIKLDTIAEAGIPVTTTDMGTNPAAGKDPIATIKSYIDNRKAQAFIDSKDGMVKYMDIMGARDTNIPPEAKVMPSDWIANQAPDLAKALAATGAGQQVKGGPFGLKLDQGTKVDLTKLTPGPAPAPMPTPGPNTGDTGDNDAAKLDALVAELEATLGNDIAPMPTPDPTPGPAPAPTPGPAPHEKTLGQKAGIGAGIGAGALAGGALGKKYGGKLGMGLGAVTGGALGGMGVNAFQEGTDLSMAKALTESFGYEFEGAQLNEYSMDQFGKDAGDFGRGAWNGVTLGTGDNIAAGVKSAFGSGTYKDELAKQTAASKEAETRSPWLYGAGNVAGSIAVPVPGGAIAGGLIKGASGMAKVARGATALGANLATQAGVDKLKQASDTKTLGYDPSKYPTTPQEIMAFQKANGLTADGKIGPKTTAVLTKMGLTPPTVAENIKSLQEKLAMIESGHWQLEEDAVYHVWLYEDGYAYGEDGKQITDESVLDAIEWDQQRLDELSLGGIGNTLGRGWDKVANVGRNIAGGLAGKEAKGNLIKGTEKEFKDKMATAVDKRTGKALSDKQIANRDINARGTANAANKAANWVGKNPGKTALGVGLAGAGGVAAANALGGGSATSPTDTTTGGGGGGGADSDPNFPPAPEDTKVPTTSAGSLTPAQQELVKQIHALMMSHGDDPNPTPVWMKSTEHAQAVLDKVEHASSAQSDQDKRAAAEAAAVAVAGEKKNADKSGAGASPTNTTDLPKVPAGTDINKSGTTMPGVKESVEDELARWLKIARG